MERGKERGWSGDGGDGVGMAREGPVTKGVAPWPTGTDMCKDTMSFLSMSWGSF